jgi:NAD(P)-dependent dehydrogenase (short-subunit alcohol dehydrogenase family)
LPLNKETFVTLTYSIHIFAYIFGVFVEKVALITGASGGLGQALVKKLLAEQWKLIVVSRDAEKLQAAYGDQHRQIIADCTTTAGVKHIFEAIKASQLQPTALAHCVGNIRLGALHRMPEAEFLDCITTNLFSAFHMLAAFVDYLKQTSVAGSAVLVSSAAARLGTPNHEAIAAAKGGLEAMVRSAAATYASADIRINAVAPGILDTPAAAKILSSDLTREMAAKQYPLKGIGNAEHVADLMAWLLSDSATRVTGQIWSIDGGFSSIRPIVK